MSVFSSINAAFPRLVDMDTSKVPNALDAWVETVQEWFDLDKTSTLTADGIAIVQPTVGPGRWVRREGGNVKWQQQASWFIDPANSTGLANDENSGLTALLPLLHDAERQRRWGFGQKLGPVAGNKITVSYLSAPAVPSNDPIALVASGGDEVEVFFDATAAYTILRASTFTAAAALNHATPIMPQVTDGTIPVSWTASGLVGSLLKLTAGASSGAFAFAEVDAGTKKATTSAWATPTGDAFSFPPLSAPTTNTYQAIGLPLFAMGEISWTGQSQSYGGPPIGTQAVFRGFAWQINSFGEAVMSSSVGGLILFEECRFDLFAGIFEGNVTFSVCRFKLGVQCFDCSATFWACTGEGFIYAGPGTNIQVDGETCFFGAVSPYQVDQGGLMSVGLGASFQHALYAFVTSPGGVLRSVPLQYGSDLIWGTSTAGPAVGIQVRSASSVVYNNKPTVTGTAGDAVVGGTPKAYAGGIPYVEAVNNAVFAAFA